MDVRRRTLLKVLGMTAAGAALPGCEREVHRLVPYLLPDDEIVPGVANWYASVCGECAAGCGILVRTMEGRAKKIEGNPAHPLNEGKVCARGQAAVQSLYHPDRVRGPLKRVGARGEGRFAEIPWEEGLALWVGQLHKRSEASAMISRPLTGSMHGLLSIFFDRLRGSLVYYDPSDTPSVLASMRASFGEERLPQFDIAHSDYMLSFGAPFLDEWLSPVHFGVAYGKFRQGRSGLRGRFVQIEPRLSLTAANADRWIPIRPGTEGLLALGIGHILLGRTDTRLSSNERRAYRSVYGRYPVELVARITEVPRETIVHLAGEFSQADAPLAIGGGLAAEHTNGTAALAAVNGLNVLAGNLGKAGGLRWSRPAPFLSGFQEPVISGEHALLDLATDFEQGRRTLLHLYGSNPLFTCPPATRIAGLFEHAEFIVSFGSFLDESAQMADLILPDHTALESWGTHVQHGLVSGPTVGLRQPAVNPFHDTKCAGDVFLDAARRLGGPVAEALRWQDFRDVVLSNWKRFRANHEDTGDARSLEEVWIRDLQRGGWWSSGDAEAQAGHRDAPPEYRPPLVAGDEREFPFWCLPYPSPALHRDGAHLPWLQELPDPLTTAVWGSWVEINPSTAQRSGIAEGELVLVRSPFGAIEAPVVLMPGIRPDAVAVPIGQGHAAYGRYAAHRGVNPVTILAPSMDPLAGTLAACGTRVRVEPTGRVGRSVLIGRSMQDDGQELIAIGRRTSRL